MKLYSAKTSQAIDRDAIENHSIPGILLMKRAGWFAFQTLQQQYPNAEHIHIVCGTGNNGGDGFVIAQYAAINGLKVSVSLLGEQSKIKGDALIALQELQQAGIKPQSFSDVLIEEADIIVDAIFGTGLNQPISGIYAEVIEQINQSNKSTVAIDIPSGIHADTGAIQGTAIRAQHTCTFITQKLGLHTSHGQERSGKVHFSSLFIDPKIIAEHTVIACNHPLKFWLNKLPKREATHHKGSAGTACLIGGNQTMMGAIQLAGLASLKSGTGLTKIISRQEHTVAITQAIPELMCYSELQQNEQSATASAIAIGPGLGRDQWALDRFLQACKTEQPKVIDADALRLLKNQDISSLTPNWVLTPHPGEAAELLNTDNQTIQNDRVSAVKNLQQKFGGIIVLKGNGTLIYDGEKLEICLAGNAGMAVGGMGDVLTGTIASFLAQGLSIWDAANLGVSVHAHAGDIIAQQSGESGLMPSEVAQTIGQLLSYSGTNAN
jgi:NAD(P)H-hydrate epimerase